MKKENIFQEVWGRIQNPTKNVYLVAITPTTLVAMFPTIVGRLLYLNPRQEIYPIYQGETQAWVI